MRTKTILSYWLLVLLPTILIGISAYRLLKHEQERIDRQAFGVIQDQARTIVDTLQLTVSALEEELTQALMRIPAERLTETLLSWRAQNPLIRNVFIWDSQNGLLLPRPGIGKTAEEEGFIRRYGALISGRLPWQASSIPLEGRTPAADRPTPTTDRGDAPYATTEQSRLVQSVQKLRKGRQSLLDLAKNAPQAELDSSPQDGRKTVAAGWMPWFAENNLYMLGWVRRQLSQRVYGVELEVMTLLSRLVADFPPPDTVPAGVVYAIIDGNGHVLHRSGADQIRIAQAADLSIPLAPQLPHWQFNVYHVDDGFVEAKGRSFLILSGLLLATLMVAILSGGALMTWQAVRNHRDARQKTTFVSNVSHELKTPLTSIRMYAELISSGRVRSEKKKTQYLDVIVSESQRLTRLVNNVLDFSRLEQGRKHYRFEAVQMNQYVFEFIEAHRMRIQSAGLTVHTRIPPEDVAATADRDVLEQVLLNLIDNAVKYAAEGKRLTMQLTSDARTVKLRVMDRGPGVPPSQRENIFKAFHRIEDALTARQPGSGLGLSIARRQLRDTGGDLYFEERPNGGSCFVVVLPRNFDRKETR